MARHITISRKICMTGAMGNESLLRVRSKLGKGEVWVMKKLWGVIFCFVVAIVGVASTAFAKQVPVCANQNVEQFASFYNMLLTVAVTNQNNGTQSALHFKESYAIKRTERMGKNVHGCLIAGEKSVDSATGAERYRTTDGIVLLTPENASQPIVAISIYIDKSAVSDWLNAAAVRLRFARMFCQSDTNMKIPEIGVIKNFIARPGAKIRYEEKNRILECSNESKGDKLAIVMTAYEK